VQNQRIRPGARNFQELNQRQVLKEYGHSFPHKCHSLYKIKYTCNLQKNKEKWRTNELLQGTQALMSAADGVLRGL
jgi:hypothetical protein